MLKKAKNPTLTGVVVLVVAIIIVIFASQILYQRTVELLTENLRERILTISITAAANIDARDLETLREEEDWMTPEWRRVVSKLHKAKYSNKDVVFMYIFRKQKDDPEMMEFVADADSIDPYANTDGDASTQVDVNRDGVVEPDGPDKLQWPGQEYPEAADIPEAWAAYDGPLTSKDLYTDAYGTVLTGYAPIKDDQGNTVAVLATDVKADDFFTITTQTLRPFLIFILSLTIVIVFLTLVIFLSWKSYADSFQQMNARLRELDQLKSQFLSFASHQLRAPLSAVRWQAQLIIDGTLGAVPKDVTDAVTQIEASAGQLSALVNEFLDLRKLQEGKMEFTFEPVDIPGLVDSGVHGLAPLAKRKGLALAFANRTSKGMASVDRPKFAQVIQNLVDNSIKYTDTGSVAVTVENDTPDTILVSVADTGHGMGPDLIPLLFEQFSRSNGDTKKIEGTGLGLYIAKQIVLAHQGKIWATSPGVGHGSTFWVRINILRA